MSAGLEKICREMADYLNAKGVEAAIAWPAGNRMDRSGALVVVSLRGCQVGAAGFQDYLGQRYDEKSGRWGEWYGRKAKLTFGVDVYAPAGGSDQLVQQAFDRLAGALLTDGPEGLRVEEFSCGETGLDPVSGRLKRPAQAVCSAYLCAVPRTEDMFDEFELRGVMKG